MTPTPEEVLKRHLELSRSHSEEDFLESYREDSFLIMQSGVRRGLEQIRTCYRQLNQELPNARFTYKAIIVEQDVGFLEWLAESDTHTVTDGADSYVIREGYIRAQTIHYTLIPKKKSMEELRTTNGGVLRGAETEIIVDGLPVQTFEGETVGAALLASGRRALRTTDRRSEPRGMYCGIGICFDCVMIVDGLPGVRTCQTLVRGGMQVETQSGSGRWRIET